MGTNLVGFVPMAPGFGRLVSDRADVLALVPADMKVKDVVWKTTFRISYRQAESYRRGPVFLAGDARTPTLRWAAAA